jgi:hypothetical protein
MDLGTLCDESAAAAEHLGCMAHLGCLAICSVLWKAVGAL